MSKLRWITAAIALFSCRWSMAAITVTFSGTLVQAAGITPGGTTVIEAALNERTATMYVRLNLVSKVLVDDDKDGAVTFDLGHPISPRSIWAIVDVASGDYVVTSPTSALLRNTVVGPTLIRKSDPNLDDELRNDGMAVSAIWVRPGIGNGTVWRVRATDGSTSDDDRTPNGHSISATASFFTLTGKDKPPKKFKKDDLIIAIDPFELTYKVVKVTQ